MRHVITKLVFIFVLIAVGLGWNGELMLSKNDSLTATAEARVGRPATPVSYAGVARRSPGVGAQPANRGGPVNRVGRR